LGNALIRLLADQELRARLVALGHERLRERFSPLAWRTATLEAYQLARERARVRKKPQR
jgi:hypothetical protein